MTEAPKRIWAWTYNLPHNKNHGARSWVDFPPVFKPWVIIDWPDWKFWVRRKTEYNQEATEYVHIDVYKELLQKYVDTNEELLDLKREGGHDKNSPPTEIQ